jgi:hypothetical protein
MSSGYILDNLIYSENVVYIKTELMRLSLDELDNIILSSSINILNQLNPELFNIRNAKRALEHNRL